MALQARVDGKQCAREHVVCVRQPLEVDILLHPNQLVRNVPIFLFRRAVAAILMTSAPMAQDSAL